MTTVVSTVQNSLAESLLDRKLYFGRKYQNYMTTVVSKPRCVDTVVNAISNTLATRKH